MSDTIHTHWVVVQLRRAPGLKTRYTSQSTKIPLCPGDVVVSGQMNFFESLELEDELNKMSEVQES